jgi:hypothetical protein
MLLRQGPIIFRKHARPTRRGPRTVPAAALQVVGVEGVFYDEPLLSFTLVFNTTAEVPLVVGELDPEQWSAVYQGGAFTGYLAEVATFDRINISVQGTAGPGGASSVSYAADPSDVSDTSGRMLAALEGFAL